MTPKELAQFCREHGFYVDTYSPGDGVTRYRFTSEPRDYFASDGDFTALGLKEATAYARGRADGSEGFRMELGS
jgi:hypothetical protein